MRSAVRKWGNSLAVRIPQAVAEQAAMMDGTEVEFSVQGGSVVITPAPSVPSLRELIDAIRPETVHGEVPSGRSKGREAW